MDKCCHKCEKQGGKFSLQNILPFSMASCLSLKPFFFIYDGIMFVANNNTIKNIYFVFLMHKGHHKC